MLRPLDLRASFRPLLVLVIAAVLAFAGIVAVSISSTTSAADVTATVYLKDSTGAGLEGGRILYGSPNGGWYTLGFTDANGLVTGSVPSGSYLGVAFREGSVYTSGPVDFSQPYTFTTSKVTMLNTGGMLYATNGNSGWRTFTSPMELLPGTYLFNNAGSRFWVTVGDTNFTGALVKLIDSQGNGLEGGTWAYYDSSWKYPTTTTNANGHLLAAVPSGSTIRMAYRGSTQTKSWSSLQRSNFTFQTARVTVNLRNADNQPLDTNAVSVYASGWRPFGGGQTVGGTVSEELLPTSEITVKITYNQSSQQRSVVVLAPSTTLDFQTGRLNLTHSAPVRWYQTSWSTYTNGMEFMPGTIRFYLNGYATACSVDITIASGDKLVKSALVATLRSSTNQPIAGGVVTAYASSWKSVGTTDDDGRVCGTLDGKLSNTSVRMTHAGTTQTISQHLPTDSYYDFMTTAVTVELRNSAGDLTDTGDASYYAGSWKTIGSTSGGTVSVEMLPGSYSFAMTYNGTRQQLNSVAISDANSVVTFSTTNVIVKLVDSAGAPLDTGNATYYAGSWRAIGDTEDGAVAVEMLPGSYSFAMVYNGTRQQLNSVPIGDTTTEVTFQTTGVIVELRDSNGDLIVDAPGAASYYAGSWRNIGDTSGGTVSVEMLPGSYSFAMTYLGTRQQLNAVEVSGNTDTVTFQTGAVTSTTGTANGYYAGSWRTFTNGMELLPGTYTFRFTGSPNKAFALQPGPVNTID